MHKITSEVSLWFITWQLYGNVGGPAGIGEEEREREEKRERLRRRIQECEQRHLTLKQEEINTFRMGVNDSLR